MRYLALAGVVVGLYVTLNGYSELLRSIPTYSPIFYIYRESAFLIVVYFMISFGSFAVSGNLTILIKSHKVPLQAYHLIANRKWRLGLNLLLVIVDVFLAYVLLRFPSPLVALAISFVTCLMAWHIATGIGKDMIFAWFCWVFSIIGIATVLFGLSLPNNMIVILGGLITSACLVLLFASKDSFQSIIVAKHQTDEEEQLLSEDEEGSDSLEGSPLVQSHDSDPKVRMGEDAKSKILGVYLSCIVIGVIKESGDNGNFVAVTPNYIPRFAKY